MIAAIRVVAQHLAAEVGKTALDDRVLAAIFALSSLEVLCA
jgi:hypothetical protein